ncbi:MAG TPA: PBP1A family penicillin-binding protein [Stellaceae bacterium]|nr:PBP1A family penicillin-binding protein [Stellaceae bacterium]
MRVFTAGTSFLRGLVQLVFVLGVIGAIFVASVVGLAIAHFSRDLPDQQQLLSYQPATGTKIYGGDGTLLAEFAAEHRIITPFKDIPPLVVHAFLAAEDRDFYNHNGVNPGAVARAALADIVRYGRGQRPLGASTITQQLVRHFLLTNEVSIARKVKEALLAYRIENQLSKDRILEIYLNEIYLGSGAYGVAAAADTYFGKKLADLTPAEAAFLAALPKAPNNYSPIHHHDAALARRNWVLDGMADQGWLTAAAAQAAKSQPLVANPRALPEPPRDAGYYVEEVRRQLIDRFGEKAVYEGGMIVRTSYVPVYQTMAEKAFRNGLVDYDRRHGWRGPVVEAGSVQAAEAMLYRTADPAAMPSWKLAAVTSVDNTGANVRLKSGATGRIPLEELRWARKTTADQRLGPYVYRAQQVLSVGDIVLVEPLETNAAARPAGRGGVSQPLYALRQVPDVSGGFMAADPKTGRIFAIVGGWDYKDSQFDRAMQAMRQPGSSFKPFVYVTALEGDYTPSSIVDDAPISLPQGPGLPMWTPVNYEGTSSGPGTLYEALVHSKNLVTARLASMIGLPSIAKTAQQFGVLDKMPLYYSMALGAGDTTLARMVAAYGMLDNGGHWLNASLIDLVQDRIGQILYQKGTTDCAACYIAAGQRITADNDPAYKPAGPAKASLIWLKGAGYAGNPILYKPAKPDPLVDPVADQQIVTMMEGVVQHGTGTKVAAVGKPIAGKTGTTSDWFDGWFVGFSPDLVAGAYVGFDNPRTLGDGEVGGNVAAPIFRDFMADALKDQPAMPFPESAPNAEMVLINSYSGQSTVSGDPNAVLMAYRPGTAPGAGHNNYYSAQGYQGSNAQMAASSWRDAPSAQEAADAIDGEAPVAPMPGAQMANAPAGRMPLPNAPYPNTTHYPGTAQYPNGGPYANAGAPYGNSAPYPNGAIPAGSMPNATMGAAPMMPVNSRVPVGTVLPPPRMGPGTGGLY